MRDTKLIRAEDVLRHKIRMMTADAISECWCDAVPTSVIEKMAAVEAEPITRGNWIPVNGAKPTHRQPLLTKFGKARANQDDTPKNGYLCSVCGRYEEYQEPYCNCGAKMSPQTPEKGRGARE